MSRDDTPADLPDDLEFCESDEPRWDENDERRKKDCFAPPQEPCECHCLHCGRTFMSDEIWLQRVRGKGEDEGFWMCPTANCGGAGFTFDIFPTDMDHPANAGWHSFDEDEEDEFEEEEDSPDWDPKEEHYRLLDEQLGDGEDDIIEGDEWKLGGAPGERPPPAEISEGQRQWEEEQRAYDEPDRRPREIDPPERSEPFRGSTGGAGVDLDEDIPF